MVTDLRKQYSSAVAMLMIVFPLSRLYKLEFHGEMIMNGGKVVVMNSW
jgi:hypothetical protein